MPEKEISVIGSYKCELCNEVQSVSLPINNKLNNKSMENAEIVTALCVSLRKFGWFVQENVKGMGTVYICPLCSKKMLEILDKYRGFFQIYDALYPSVLEGLGRAIKTKDDFDKNWQKQEK